jgi:hypothetical protein
MDGFDREKKKSVNINVKHAGERNKCLPAKSTAKTVSSSRGVCFSGSLEVDVAVWVVVTESLDL